MRWGFIALLAGVAGVAHGGGIPPKITPADKVVPVTQVGRMKISSFGVDLIVHFEVGGRAYYTKAYSRPIHPGNSASGVTIGIGYDLRFSSASKIAQDWGGQVSPTDLKIYQSCSGLKGDVARQKQRQIKFMVQPIPLEVAMDVFVKSTMPDYTRRAAAAFPKIGEGPVFVQDAVFSVAYNRGTSKSGSSRRHVAAMAEHSAARRWDLIDNDISDSKVIWAGQPSIRKGIWRRRDAEALHAQGRGQFIPEGFRTP